MKKSIRISLTTFMAWGLLTSCVMAEGDSLIRIDDNTRFIKKEKSAQMDELVSALNERLEKKAKEPKVVSSRKLSFEESDAKLKRLQEEVELERKKSLRAGVKGRDIDLSPEYDFTNRGFRQKIINEGVHFGLVMSGWSESSLGKMGRTNQEKAKREFAKGYTLMMDTEAHMRTPKGEKAEGRMIYLSMNGISPDYRYYLYKSYHRKATVAEWKEFDKRVLTIINFEAPPRKKGDPYDISYLNEGYNASMQLKLYKALNALRLDSEVKTRFVGFTGHFTGPMLKRWADEMEVPYLLNPPEKADYISKTKSRRSFRDAGVLHPIGTYEPTFSIEGVINEIYNVLSDKRVSGNKIVMKLDQSAGGYGNRIIRFPDFNKQQGEAKNKEIIRAFFTADMAKDDTDRTKKFSTDFVKRIESDGAIVEQFIEGENFTSPATIYIIDGQGKVHLIYTYDQLLGGADKEVFKGSLGPVPTHKDPLSNIEHLSTIIGNHLSKNGVRGVVGTDFVIVDDGIDEFGNKKFKVYAIENNVRNTGTSYPLMTVRNFLGYDLKGKVIKSYDDVPIPELNYHELRADVLSKLLPALATHRYNLNRETGEGCLIHLETARLGKLGVVCVANSKERCEKLFEAYTKNIQHYIQSLSQVQQLIRFNQARRNPGEIKGKDFSSADFIKDNEGHILTDKDPTTNDLSIMTESEATELDHSNHDFSFGDFSEDESDEDSSMDYNNARQSLEKQSVFSQRAHNARSHSKGNRFVHWISSAAKKKEN